MNKFLYKEDINHYALETIQYIVCGKRDHIWWKINFMLNPKDRLNMQEFRKTFNF